MTEPPGADPESQATRNRKKKLRSKYLDMLRLEQQQGLGVQLNAEQLAKLGRKAEVEAELAQLGCQLPQLAAPALHGSSASTGEAAAAAGGGEAAGGGAARPPSPALRHQMQLKAQNPNVDYFLVLPAPLPDMGIMLTAFEGKVFLEVMRARAEKGEPRAVHMLYQQLLPSVQQLGCPPMQLRLQLAVEYGFDPLTQQAVGGSEEEALAWLERQMAPAELAAERQAFERMAQQLAAQTLGARDARGSGGGKGGKRR